MKNTLKLNSTLYAHHKDFVALFAMRTLAKSLCVSWPSVNARGGQILCVPTISQLDFERELYPLLLDSDTAVWKKLANDKTLSNQARLRSAYLYVYLSKTPLKLNFDIEEFRNQFSFYHGNRCEDGDGYARMFGLKNGLDNMRFNQFKNTGGF